MQRQMSFNQNKMYNTSYVMILSAVKEGICDFDPGHYL